MKLLTHGYRTASIIVYFHGLSNCPKQFEALGEELFARGHNVLMARLPYHGYLDPGDNAMSQLTAEELVTVGGDIVDIAQGLGDRVVVVGFSMGGTVTGWLAQRRSDIDRAVLISPSLGVGPVPHRATRALTNFLLTVPSFRMWWDPSRREKWQGPGHVVPYFASRALGEILRLAAAVRSRALESGPRAGSVVIITNANDSAINNRVTDELIDIWRRTAPEKLETFEFGSDEKLIHDLIDPRQKGARIDHVYPILLEKIEGSERRDPGRGRRSSISAWGWRQEAPEGRAGSPGGK